VIELMTTKTKAQQIHMRIVKIAHLRHHFTGISDIFLHSLPIR